MIPHQAPDSSSRGFIAPSADPFSFDDPDLGFDEGFWQPIPEAGQALDDLFQQMVAGICQLDGTLVRPRWQAEPPDLPDFGTDWAAVGITARRPIGPWSAVQHDSRGNGRDWLQRHEYVDLLATFYGPNADANAGQLQDGLMIAQNREFLYLNHLGFTEVTSITRLPELIKNRWTERFDVRLIFSRIVIRLYPVRSLVSAAGSIATDTGYTSPWQAPWP